MSRVSRGRSRPRWTSGLALLLLVFALLGVGNPLTASAHAALESTTPADGSTVDTVPTEVSLTFNEALRMQYTQVAVLDERGNTYQSGEPTVLDATVTQPVSDLNGTGPYRVSYRVVSADGHPVSGTVQFTIRAGAQSGAGAESTPPAAGGLTPPSAPTFQPMAAVFGALAAAIGVVAYVLSRRGPRRRETSGAE